MFGLLSKTFSPEFNKNDVLPEAKVTRFPSSAHEVSNGNNSDGPGASSNKTMSSPQQNFVENGKTFPVHYYKPLSLPNDPSASQWWTTATGLDQSWQLPSGSRQTTVAIIDSGFALNHEDLNGRWAINEAEIGSTEQEAPSTLNKQNCTERSIPIDKSCNLIDDDNNGFIDDVKGWDFVNNDSSPQAGEVSPQGASVSHGTSVAGVLAATGNNAKGIAGVDWSTKILPLQALGDDEDGTTLTVARAIYYAVGRGVDVINLSLGGDIADEYLRNANRLRAR